MSVRLAPLILVGVAGLGIAAINSEVDVDIPDGVVSMIDERGSEAREGSATERSVKVGAFEQIRVLGPYRVKVLSEGQAGLVRASGPSGALDEMAIRVEDDTLVIEPRRRAGIQFGGRTNKPVTVTLTARQLSQAMIAGSGTLSVAQVQGDFRGEVAGSGRLALDKVVDGRLSLAIAGSGDIEAKGAAETIEVSIAGSGDVVGDELDAKNAEVSIAGSGDVVLKVRERAEVTTMGSGDVRIVGGAQCSISKNGSGDVECD